jgi:hypothetical protein
MKVYTFKYLKICSSVLNPTLLILVSQGCGSGLDPDSIGSVDPDPDSETGSGSRRAKMTHKSRIFFYKFML